MSAKARTFDGSSDNLQSAATIDLTSTTQLSIAFWLYIDAYYNSDRLALETSSDYNANAGAFIVDPDRGDGLFSFGAHSSGYLYGTFTRPSAGAWHHYLLTLDITTFGAGVLTAYVDGVDASPSTFLANIDGGTFGNFTLNVMSRNASSLFLPGRMSDIALWKSILTGSDAASMAACTAPSAIGPPDFYWPINQTSPEVATYGGVDLTVSGTGTADSNCAGTPTRKSGNLLMMWQ